MQSKTFAPKTLKLQTNRKVNSWSNHKMKNKFVRDDKKYFHELHHYFMLRFQIN